MNLIPRFSEKYLGYKLDIPNKLNFEDLENVFYETVIEYLYAYEDEEYSILHNNYGIFLKGFMNACDHLASGSQYKILSIILFF